MILPVEQSATLLDTVYDYVTLLFTAAGGLTGLFVAGKWVMEWWNSRKSIEADRESAKEKVELETRRHSEKLMSAMLERANEMIERQGRIISDLEQEKDTLAESNRRLKEAVEHIIGLKNAPDEVALRAAQVRAEEFLARIGVDG